MGWAVDAIQQPFYLKDRAVVPVELDEEWASGPAWTSVGKENLFASLKFEPQTIQPIVSPYTNSMTNITLNILYWHTVYYLAGV